MKFKRIISALLTLAIALPCFTVLASAAYGSTESAIAEQGTEVASEIVVKDGAKSVLTMTYDDGHYESAVWMNEMFEKYDLRASCMMIPVGSHFVPTGGSLELNDAKVAPWIEILNKGYLSLESHSMTHDPIPGEAWPSYDQYKDNNTTEKITYEIVDSKTVLEAAFGRPVLTFAPSNNTLCVEATQLAMQTYYAIRQGVRGSDTVIQSISPVESSDTPGGWYNLYMYGLDTASVAEMKKYAQACIDNGGWFVSMTHGVANDAAKMERYEEFYQFLAEKQAAGDVWVATFTDATKYLREKQNSTSSAYMQDGKVFLNVTMKDKTGEGLALSSDIFNMPLTVKVEVPETWRVVSYNQNGEDMYAKTFTDGGKTYAYVNAVPNGGEVKIASVETDESNKNASIAGYITADGAFIEGDMITSSYTEKFRVDENVKVYAKLSLSEYTEGTSAVIPIKVNDELSGIINVYGIINKSLSENWSAATLNPYNAPGNDIFGVVDKNAALIESLEVTGADTYLVDISSYVEDMSGIGAEYATVIFALDDYSAAKKIGFEFGTKDDVSTDGSASAAPLYTFKQNFESATAHGFITGGIGGVGSADGNSFVLGETEGYMGESTKCIIWSTNQTYERVFLNNVLSETNTLTEDDIGSVYKITFRLKAEKAGELIVWLGNSKSRAHYPNATTEKLYFKIAEADVGKWIKYTCNFVITDQNLVEASGGQNTALAFSTKSFADKPATLYLDDIVSERLSGGAGSGEGEENTNVFVPYSFSQNFDSASSHGFKPGGIGSNEGNSFDLGEAEGYLGTTTKCVVWKSTRNYERVFLPKVLNASNTLTEADIGSVYRITFRFKAERAGQFVVWLGNYDTRDTYSTVTADKRYIFTVAQEDVGKWINYKLNVTIDQSNVTVAAKGGQNISLAFTPMSFAQSPDDPVMLYIDDITSTKVNPGAKSAMIPLESKALLSSDGTMFVGGKKNVTDGLKYSYISFNKSDIDPKISAELKLFIKATSGQKIKVYALLGAAVSSDMTFTEAPGFTNGAIDTAKIFLGVPMYNGVANAGILTLDIADYVKTQTENCVFLVVTDDVSDKELVNFDFESMPVTSDIDFTTDGTVNIAGGVMNVTGSVTFGNLFGMASVGEKYLVSACVPAGVTLTAGEGSVIATEAGIISLEVAYAEGITSVTFSSGTAFSLDDLKVTLVKSCVVIGADSTVSVLTEGEYVELNGYSTTLGHTLGINFYAKLPESVKTVNITVAGRTAEFTVANMEAISAGEYAGNYKFSSSVSSVNVRDDVSISFLTEGGKAAEIRTQNESGVTSYTTSVYSYANALIADATQTAVVKNAAEALLNYAAYAEVYFRKTSAPHESYNADSVAKVPAVDKSAVSGTTEGTSEKLGVAYLILDNTTKIRVALSESATVESESANIVYVENESGFFVEIRDIDAKNLDTVYTFKVDGTDVKISALGVASVVVNDEATYGEDFVNLMKALYLYSEACEKIA